MVTLLGLAIPSRGAVDEADKVFGQV
jgi:hypothetical protein